MKLTEILTEDQLNEVVLAEGVVGNIGTKIGKGVGSVARGIGAVAGGAVGSWDAMKQGFATGREVVSGIPAGSRTSSTGTTTPTTGTAPGSTVGTGGSSTGTATTGSSGTAGTTPAAIKLTAKEINAAIPTLNLRSLQSVKRTVDNAIASKQPAPVATTSAATPVVPTGTKQKRAATPENVIFTDKFLKERKT